MADQSEPVTAPPVDPDAVATHRTPLHTRPLAIAAVAVGGLIGAPARYELGVLFPQTAGRWPVTTFAVNITGAFVLGLLLEWLTRLGSDSGWRQRVRLGAGTGLLGSFTTYSTLAVDTDQLLRGHHWWAAGSYAVGSVLAGLVAAVVGIAVGVQVPSPRPEADG